MNAALSPLAIAIGAALVLLGCGAEPAPLGLGKRKDAGSPDASTGPDAGVPERCTISLTGPDRASAGGRLALELQAPLDALVSVDLPVPGARVARNGLTANLHIPYESVGTLTVIARARCGDEEVTAEHRVRVEPPAWRPLGDWSQSYAQNPYHRQLSNLLFDQEDPGSLLLYGGVSVEAQDYVQDLWAFDTEDEHWEMILDAHVPGMSGGEMLATIPGEPAFLVTDAFSGWEGSNTPYAIFRVDYAGEGVGATRIPIRGGPNSGSFGGAFVYVPHLDRYLLACGIGELRTHCDVALLDLESGEMELPPIEGAPPSGRYSFAWAYDEENKRLVLFSGGQEPVGQNSVNPAQDTWALELETRPFRWMKIEIENPPGRRNPCYALDPDGHRLFVWGGTPNARDVLDGLQVLDLDRGFEAWTRLDLPGTPPVRSSGSSVFDRAGKRAIFGFGNTSEEIFVDLHALEL